MTLGEHWMACDSAGFAKAVQLLLALTEPGETDHDETSEGDGDDRSQVLD